MDRLELFICPNSR